MLIHVCAYTLINADFVLYMNMIAGSNGRMQRQFMHAKVNQVQVDYVRKYNIEKG